MLLTGDQARSLGVRISAEEDVRALGGLVRGDEFEQVQGQFDLAEVGGLEAFEAGLPRPDSLQFPDDGSVPLVLVTHGGLRRGWFGPCGLS